MARGIDMGDISLTRKKQLAEIAVSDITPLIIKEISQCAATDREASYLKGQILSILESVSVSVETPPGQS